MQEKLGPRPFDVGTGSLIDRDPAAWLACVGLPVDGPVSVIESDVSTVLAEVDKVLRVDGPSPWLAHLELQSTRDPQLPLRLLQYHALLLNRHKLSVASSVILLRPQADGPEMARPLATRDPRGHVTLSFSFDVIRIWQRPVDEILSGGIGTLPLAPISAVEEGLLPDVVRRMQERIDREAEPSLAKDLWAATLILMGLRYDKAMAERLLRGVRGMHESVTYQAILNEGDVRTARRILLRQGTKKFGVPDAHARGIVETLSDLEALEDLSERLLTVSTWSELLAPVDNSA